MIRKKIVVLSLLVLTLFAGIAVVVYASDDDFNQCDLDRVIKGDKNLAGIKIEGANLKGMDFSGADLRGAEMEKTDLEGANLTNANLQNADLEEANLKYAKITGTNFRNAELEYAVWVDGRVCAEGSVGSCW